MISIEAINKKYMAIAERFGAGLEIVYQPGLTQTHKLEGDSEHFVIKLNADQISEADYEAYLSYHVRKIILPRLWLETERLVIRRFRRSDAEACFAFLSDRDNAYMDDGTFFIGMDEDYDRLMDAYADQTRYLIEVKETGSVIGTINLFDAEDRAVETMEIGYCIAPECKRRGYAYEALSALLRYLLYDLNLDMVIAGVIPDNIPSLGLLEKLGFQYEGLKHKALWNQLRGPVDLKYYYLEK